MNLKTERFEMRLDESLLERIDTWRGKQDDLPSRAEAIRRLIEFSLTAMSDSSVTMHPSEKLIVGLLCELHKGLKIKGELEPEFIESAVRGGHYWGLKWKYEGLLNNYSDDEETLHEVVDILDMWYFLESAHEKMSKEDKDFIKAKAKHVGNDVQFHGFDGNNEFKQISIARFLIEEMDRFTEFKDRDLNCHYPSIEIHRRMLNVFIPIRRKLVGRALNAKEIVEILSARVHPSMRDKADA